MSVSRQRGAVAAGHPRTAAAAAEILHAGGNAFDAACAALATACSAEPILASLGGGGFLNAQPAGERPRLYDFFVQTPRHKCPPDACDFYPITADFGSATQDFHIGLGSIATPGLVRGLFAVHGDLGRMPLSEVLQPAIQAAREGVEINPLQAYISNIVAAIFTASPAAIETFRGGAGAERRIIAGDCRRFPELANLLEGLAGEGEDLFYRGEVAQRLVAMCASGGGHLRAADLADYRVARREPLAVEHGGWRLYSNPPPSSGGLLVAFGLRLMEAAAGAALEFGDAARLRLLAQSMALTQKARLDAHVDEGDEGMLRLLAPDYLASYRSEIAGRAAALRGTTHISVADAAGNLAALTVSNGEGCGQLVPDCGFMPNNMLGEEDLNPGGFMRWACDQRMTSMMAPTLGAHRDGRRLITGSGGSNRIRSALLQVLLNIIDHGMSAEQAVAAPRLHLEGEHLALEAGFSRAAEATLLDDWPDHQVWEEPNFFFGGAHSLLLTDSGISGAGDARRGGVFVTA